MSTLRLAPSVVSAGLAVGLSVGMIFVSGGVGAQGYCPQQLNAPGADEPTDTNWSAQTAEAKAVKRFLKCTPTLLAPIVGAELALRPEASKDPFSTSVYAALRKAKRSSNTALMAAQAIHVHALLNDSKSGDFLLQNFEAAWIDDWCSGFAKSRRPVRHPNPPPPADELPTLNPRSIRVGRAVASKLRPLPTLTCDKAVSTWVSQATR
jgi:hypothetical protein